MYVGSFGRGKVTSYAEMSYGAAAAAATKLHTHKHGAAAKHLCVASRRVRRRHRQLTNPTEKSQRRFL